VDWRTCHPIVGLMVLKFVWQCPIRAILRRIVGREHRIIVEIDDAAHRTDEEKVQNARSISARKAFARRAAPSLLTSAIGT
jgi:very-short-patch-repair endonuclease